MGAIAALSCSGWLHRQYRLAVVLKRRIASLISWRVINQRTDDTAIIGWTDQVFASTDAVLSNDDILLDSFNHRGLLNMPLLDPNQIYTFSRYFELGFEASELAAEFGYSLTRKVLKLQQFSGELDRLQELTERIEEVLPYVPLTNELARREIIIARVVTELIHYTRAELRIEYPLKVSNQLQGNLDYLLRLDSPHTQLLVIEAKYEDLTRGFTQLMAELAAIDQWENSPDVSTQPVLVGAVSTGTIWQFGKLDRIARHFDQGINSYRVPEDLDPLLRILIAALRKNN